MSSTDRSRRIASLGVAVASAAQRLGLLAANAELARKS